MFSRIFSGHNCGKILFSFVVYAITLYRFEPSYMVLVNGISYWHYVIYFCRSTARQKEFKVFASFVSLIVSATGYSCKVHVLSAGPPRGGAGGDNGPGTHGY